MSENRDYIVLRSSQARCSSYNLDFTNSDPYDYAFVRRYDQLLRRTLSKIFRERRLTSSQIRILVRVPRKHSTNKNSIFKLILEREPALGKLLLKRSKLSLLWIAVLSCYQESAELLLHSGADLNELYGLDDWYTLTQKSTLLQALMLMYPSSWNERFIGLVMDHGVDLNARDSRAATVLHLATRMGRVKVTEMLLQKGADVNATHCCNIASLHEAASTSEVNVMVPLLIKYGADITAKDKHGCNVLHHLALSPNRKNVELAKVLIEKGISPCEVVSGQDGPIHEAVIMNNIELVNLFLDHGANVNARGFEDETPLHIAAECKDPAMLLNLLNRGADIDLKDSVYGDIILHRLLGSDENTIQKIKILLSVGADILVENNEGSTFLDLVYRLNNNNAEHPSIRLILKTLALNKACLQPSIEFKAEKIFEEKYPELKKYYQDCIDNINWLKGTRFIKSCKFYDLLTKCQCQIAPLMRNREFVNKFRLYDLSVFSPIYAEDVLEAFKRAKHFYNSLLKQEDLIDEAFDYILPYIFARKTTSYLVKCEICELKKIVQASRSILM